MELIFDIQTNGEEEIRKVTGFTDADFNYESLKPSLETALDELCKIIGRKTYEAIFKYYDVEEPTENENEIELIKKTQSCLAFRAIMLFAPLKDLAFTNQGRAMRSDEHHKSAFEWQIDRHNQTLEATYYKNIDRLIEALDEINPEIEPSIKWKDTDEYKNSFDVLFRTTDEFNEFFTIESRYLLMKLAPAIRRVKANELVPRLTAEVVDEYMDKLKANQPVPDEQILYQMKAACAYLALAWAVPRMSATLFPSGVLQAYVGDRMTTQAKKVPEKSEVGVLALCFEEDGKAALIKLEEMLCPLPEPGDELPLYEMKINPCQKFVST